MTDFEAKTGFKFETYYEKYQPKLVRFLTTLGKDQEEAHDVATEAFITSMERIDMYDPEKAVFSTWLFTIAKRIMIQKLREKSRFSSIEHKNDDGLSIGDTLRYDDYNYESDHNFNSYKSMLIKNLIPNLPKKYAAVLMLRHIKNYSYQDIADELDVNLNTIKSRIRQARLLICKITLKEFTYIDSLDTLEQLDHSKITIY